MSIFPLFQGDTPLEIIRQGFNQHLHYVLFTQSKKHHIHVIDIEKNHLLETKTFSDTKTAYAQYCIIVLSDSIQIRKGITPYADKYPELPPQGSMYPAGVMPCGESKGGHLP